MGRCRWPVALATAGLACLCAAPSALAIGEPTNDSPPTVSGTARWGGTLTSTTGSWSSVFPINRYERQWVRCTTPATGSCTTIPEAIGAAYKLTGSDVGYRIRLRVRASNNNGFTYSAPAFSGPTAVVVADPPNNTSLPRFSGDAREGKLLTRASYGSWGSPTPTGYSRQWLRCDATGGGCATVAGAIGDSYLLRAADVGHAIRLRVQANGPYGADQAFSAPSEAVVKRSEPAPAKPKPKRISPFPRIVVAGALSSGGAFFRQVVVRGPRNVTVRVRCKGRGCPYRKRSYRMRRRRLRIRSLERNFRSGAVIELRVVKAGRVGKYTRIRIRRGRVPKRLDRCLNPGSSRPKRCGR